MQHTNTLPQKNNEGNCAICNPPNRDTSKRKYRPFRNLLMLICTISCLVGSSELYAQTCGPLPPPITITKKRNLSAKNCDAIDTSYPVLSGGIYGFKLSIHNSYKFTLCPDGHDMTGHFDLFEAPNYVPNGTAFSSGPPDADGCVSYTYSGLGADPDLDCDGEFLIAPYTHSCIPDWKKWTLTVDCGNCTIDAEGHFGAAINSNDCMPIQVDIPWPTIVPEEDCAICPSIVRYTLCGGGGLPLVVPFVPVIVDLDAPPNPSLSTLPPLGRGSYIIKWELLPVSNCDNDGNPSTPIVIATATTNITIDVLLICNDNINVTMDAGCWTQITPDMMLEEHCPNEAQYEVTIDGQNTDLVYTPGVHTASVKYLPTGRTCWGTVTVEDKSGPTCNLTLDQKYLNTTCADDDTLFEPTFDDCTGVATSNCGDVIYGECGELDLEGAMTTNGDGSLADELCAGPLIATDGTVITLPTNGTALKEFMAYKNAVTPAPCSVAPAFLLDHIIIKRCIATDVLGYIGDCEQTIFVWRPAPGAIYAPFTPIEVECGTDLSVDSLAVLFPNSVPYYYDLDAACNPTIPVALDLNHACKYSVGHVDVPLDSLCGSTVKFLREWTILDWCSGTIVDANVVDDMNVCTQVSMIDFPQTIKTVDNTDPEFTDCPTATDVGGSYANPIIGNTSSANQNSCYFDGLLDHPTATDLCGNPIDYSAVIFTSLASATGTTSTGSIVSSVTDLSLPVQLPEGHYYVEFTATDDCGNTAICPIHYEIVDDEKPVAICDENTVISLTNNSTALICAADLDSGSYDNCGITTREIAFMGANGPGTFSNCLQVDCDDSVLMIVLRVWDAAGNYNECMIEITVQDKLPPLIVCPSDITIDCEADVNDSNVTGAAATATDPCGATITFTDDYSFMSECAVGTITRTWSATDPAGNVSTCDQIISVEDTTSPIYHFFGDTSLVCESLTDTFGEPTISDNCGLYYTGFQDLVIIDEPCFLKVQRTWIIQDACTGAEVSQNMTILVDRDDVEPSFSGAPTLITIACTDPIPDPIAPTIYDECDANLVIEMTETTGAGTCGNNTAVIRTWTATDDCGNVGTFVQTVDIVDVVDPVFTSIPPNMSLDCSDVIPSDAPTATDNCDTDVAVVMTEETFDGSCADNRTIVRTWTATDDCGNSAVLIQSISIGDSAGPTFNDVPQDLSVSCDATIPFAEPTASDNCTEVVSIEFQESSLDGDCSSERVITRTWTATDVCGNTAFVTQTIFVVDDTPPVITGVQADTIVACNQNLPFVIPIVTDNCGSDFSLVEVRDSIGDECFRTITRTFTATDACGNISVAEQIVTIADTVPPIFTILPINRDITLDRTDTACEMAFDLVAAEATDNCDDDVTITTIIDFYSDGVIYSNGPVRSDTSFVGADASGIYPLGRHTVSFAAVDDCGNFTVRERIISLEESRPPQNGCESIEIFVEDNSTMFVVPSDVVIESLVSDECTDVRTTFFTDFPNLTPTADTLSFVCGDDDYRFTVGFFDAFSNVSDCSSTIFVNCSTGNKPIVAGKILTEDGEGVEGVGVDMDEKSSSTSYTDEYGLYAFRDVEDGMTCDLTPNMDMDYLNGVTTYDLVIMQKHILGIDIIDTPYKLVAADVNDSKSITTADVVALRQAILFIIPEFPNDNPSWKFVDSEYKFPNPTNPFEDDMIHSHLCENIKSSMLNMDFIAVKIGDVNNSAHYNSLQQEAETRSDESFAISIADLNLRKGKQYQITFDAAEIDAVSALQFTLNFEQDALEFVGMNDGLLSTANVGKSLVNRGSLTCSWDNFSNEVLNTTELFTLEFRAKANVALSDVLTVNSLFTKAVAFDNGGESIAVNLGLDNALGQSIQVETSTVDTSIEANADQFELHQNRPNPFSGKTVISFKLPEDSAVDFEIYDLAGKRVWSKNQTYAKGYNEVILDGNSLPSAGIYYYHLKTNFGTASKKMLLFD